MNESRDTSSGPSGKGLLVSSSPWLRGRVSRKALPCPGAPQACTITISVPEASLGIKPGAGLYSITGLSAYQFDVKKPPLLVFEGGNSGQADAATAFDDNGTGTTK